MSRYSNEPENATAGIGGGIFLIAVVLVLSILIAGCEPIPDSEATEEAAPDTFSTAIYDQHVKALGGSAPLVFSSQAVLEQRETPEEPKPDKWEAFNAKLEDLGGYIFFGD